MLRRVLLAGAAAVGLGVFASKAEAHPWGYYGGPVYGPVVYHSPVIYGGPRFYGGPVYHPGYFGGTGFNVNYSRWDGGWGRRGWGGPGWGGPGWGGPRSGFSISIGRGGWGW